MHCSHLAANKLFFPTTCTAAILLRYIMPDSLWKDSSSLAGETGHRDVRPLRSSPTQRMNKPAHPTPCRSSRCPQPLNCMLCACASLQAGPRRLRSLQPPPQRPCQGHPPCQPSRTPACKHQRAVPPLPRGPQGQGRGVRAQGQQGGQRGPWPARWTLSSSQYRMGWRAGRGRRGRARGPRTPRGGPARRAPWAPQGCRWVGWVPSCWA